MKIKREKRFSLSGAGGADLWGREVDGHEEQIWATRNLEKVCRKD